MRYNINDVNKLIKDRRTIFPEQFSPKKVDNTIVLNVLENAQWAPTHGYTEPWQFKVFTGQALKSLSEFLPNLYKKLNKGSDFKQAKFNKLKNRPLMSSVIIAVCMQRDRKEKILEIEEIEAVACAVQNMYLTCTAHGVGGFWATPKVIYSSEMNKFLGLKDQDKCLGLFYLGYPNINWPKGKRKPIENHIEWMTAL